MTQLLTAHRVLAPLDRTAEGHSVGKGGILTVQTQGCYESWVTESSGSRWPKRATRQLSLSLP